MKNKALAILMAIVLCGSLISFNGFEAKAEDTGEDVDLSYLLTDDAMIGYSENMARGVYLAEGYSIINKISSTKIGAGGVTNAAVKCKVSITTILERQTTTGWARVTSWTQTNEDAYSAMISKSIIVSTGYWYRVRSLHYASSDGSSSGAGALWMGN